MSAPRDLLEIFVGNRTLPIWTQFWEVVRKAVALTDEEEDFVLALRYCAGRERSMPATEVVRFARGVEQAIRSEEAKVLYDLAGRFPGCSPTEIVSDWLAALAILRAEASVASTVRWIAPMSKEQREQARARFAGLLKALDEGRASDQ